MKNWTRENIPVSQPSAVHNPFYALVPTWGLFPMIGLATVPR